MTLYVAFNRRVFARSVQRAMTPITDAVIVKSTYDQFGAHHVPLLANRQINCSNR